MEIRTKTILILTLTLVTLIIIIGIASEILVAGGFARVEDQAAAKDTNRALAALADDINTLDAVAVDWISRGPGESYFSKGSAGGVPSTLDDQTFERLALNYILFTDASGTVVAGRGYDLEQHQTIPIPSALTDMVAPSSPLRDPPFMENGTMGIVQTPSDSLLVAVRPAHAPGATGVPTGYLIMARNLDANEVSRLSVMSQLDLDIWKYRANGPKGEIDAQLAGSAPAGGQFLNRTGPDSFEMDAPALRQIRDTETIYGYALVRDVYGQPALVLAAEIPRDISKQGTSTILYFLTLLLISGIIVGIVMVALVERTVLSRLLSLSSHVSTIGTGRDFSARVSVPGNDEITDLATNVNSMLGELEQCQLGLQVRLSQSEENYRLFFNSITDPVIICQYREGEFLGIIIEANDAVIDVLGYSREELFTMSPGAFVKNGEQNAAVSGRLRADGYAIFESVYLTRSGMTIPVEINAHVFDYFGQKAVLAIARDITERRDIERLKMEAFQQIEKNMQQFAILNDHIRNPLQGIIGTADMIEHKHSGRIIELARVINDIVDKLDRGYLESEKIQEFLRKYYGVDKK
ncbi:MAG: PAS domain S-box protein [Methanoregula sp.]|nr:MAG: PAS domain S-box protein [Methanoregula sp.]